MLSTINSAEAVGKTLNIEGCGQLDLSYTPIGIEGALALSHALKTSTTWRKNLTHLNLTYSAVGWGHMFLLSQLLETRQLRSIDLSGNWLGDESIVRIFRLMRKAKFLQVLRLRWNGITERYAAKIATATRSCTG
jgi:Ran GTPase-activating protein (RanGAP) involved in mRNA processing and transport